MCRRLYAVRGRPSRSERRFSSSGIQFSPVPIPVQSTFWCRRGHSAGARSVSSKRVVSATPLSSTLWANVFRAVISQVAADVLFPSARAISAQRRARPATTFTRPDASASGSASLIRSRARSYCQNNRSQLHNTSGRAQIVPLSLRSTSTLSAFWRSLLRQVRRCPGAVCGGLAGMSLLPIPEWRQDLCSGRATLSKRARVAATGRSAFLAPS